MPQFSFIDKLTRITTYCCIDIEFRTDTGDRVAMFPHFAPGSRTAMFEPRVHRLPPGV